MFETSLTGIGKYYFKAAPTEHAFHYRDGSIRHEGQGIGFWTNLARDSVVLVPMSEWDDPFTITHRSMDDQMVTIAGKMLYQVTDPSAFCAHYNFSIDPVIRQHYTTDKQRMVSRLGDNVSDSSRVKIRGSRLKELMDEKDDLGAYIRDAVNKRITEWGMRCNWIYVAQIAPADKGLVEAIEAPYRQTLLMEQDKAVHERTKTKRELSTTERIAAVADEERVSLQDYEAERTQLDRKLELAKLTGAITQYDASLEQGIERAKLEILNASNSDVLLYKGLEAISQAGHIGTLNITPELLQALRSEMGREHR